MTRHGEAGADGYDVRGFFFKYKMIKGMKIKSEVRVRRAILTIVICLMGVRGLGQGTKLSSFPLVTTDTGISLVCVSDSGGAYMDKLLPEGLFASYLAGTLSTFYGLDFVLHAGNTTNASAVFNDGAGHINTISPLAIDVYETIGYHGIVRDTAVYLTDVGSNPVIGFNMLNGVATSYATDATTGHRITYHVGPLTSMQNWWWRNKSDTVAGLNDIWSDSSTLATKATLYKVVDSAVSAFGSATLHTVTYNGDSTSSTIQVWKKRAAISSVSLDTTGITVYNITGDTAVSVSDSAVSFKNHGYQGHLLAPVFSSANLTWILPLKNGTVSLATVGSYTNAAPSTATTFTVSVPLGAASCVATSATPAVIVVSGCSVSSATMTITCAAASIGGASITLNYVYQ
jgi:hypothetical protein